MKQNQRGFSEIALILVILVIVVLVGVVGFFVYQNNQLKQNDNQTDSTVTETPKPINIISSGEVENETADWDTYAQSELGFSIKYPKDEVVIGIDYKSDWHGVVFTYSKYNGKYGPYGLANLQILERGAHGKNPIDGLKSETFIKNGEYQFAEYEEVQINNAYGIRTTSGFGSEHNYYVTDADKSGPVLRVSAGTDDNEEDIETFKKMLKTFKFIR